MTTTPERRTATLSELVAEEVRAWLGRRRMSQAQLARAIGQSQMWVSDRLRGIQPISLDDLQRFASALDLTVHDLLPTPDDAAGASQPRPAHTRRVGGTPNSRSTQVIRPVSPVAGYGPFGQKPAGSTRPGSPKRRPVLIGPGRRAM
jgi:transcriptional regulator with XRE-family HTH domain